MKVKYTCIALLLMTLIGCASVKPPKTDTTPALGDSISASKALVTSASESVTQAVPHADTVGQAHLQSASSDLKSTLGKLDTASTDLTKVQAEAAQQRAAYQALDIKYTRYDQGWFGGKTLRLAHWLIGIWVGVGILGFVLSAIGGPVMGGVGTQLLHVLPISNVFTLGGSLVTYVIGLFRKPTAKAATPTAAPVPAAGGQ